MNAAPQRNPRRGQEAETNRRRRWNLVLLVLGVLTLGSIVAVGVLRDSGAFDAPPPRTNTPTFTATPIPATRTPAPSLTLTQTRTPEAGGVSPIFLTATQIFLEFSGTTEGDDTPTADALALTQTAIALDKEQQFATATAITAGAD